jgi:hypothetical protein
VIHDPEGLPPLPPAAQLIWLGIEAQRPSEVIDAALFRQFPALTPYDIVDAWEASASFRKRDLHRQEVLLACTAFSRRKGTPPGDRSTA